MTSQQKADAWLWAASLIESECCELSKRGEMAISHKHALEVVAPHLRRMRERVLKSPKAKRESSK